MSGAVVSGAESPAVKPLRKDAQRNRDLLLDAAAKLFAEHGVDYPLEDVARDAGVGIGTLYRHFPTRNALVEAVYRREVAALCESVDGLLATLEPVDALDAWMHNFVVYVATKRGLSATLREMMDAEPDLFTETRANIRTAAGRVLDAAVESGGVRPVLDADDLVRAMSSICMSADDPEHPERASKLVGVLLDGMRTHH
ncbi:MAG TPA: TetR/AcrR family transcriptional regulator [Candidatus Nanopelagicales bacterium]|nr:TetR/AcrR family transcriptional regulator [Candidatus Nanopelagicales bacterium]